MSWGVLWQEWPARELARPRRPSALRAPPGDEVRRRRLEAERVALARLVPRLDVAGLQGSTPAAVLSEMPYGPLRQGAIWFDLWYEWPGCQYRHDWRPGMPCGREPPGAGTAAAA
jgi:hypothetical protein